MSKNLTRKGLALGALVALSSTLIAGAPAFAANEVTLAPTVGTTYGAISGQAFTLQASAGATISSGSYGLLKYKIANPSALELSTVFTQTGSATASDLITDPATSAVVKSLTGTVTGSYSTLAVTATAGYYGSINVTSWIDSNDNDVVDGTEYASSTQTITFVQAANVTWTTALTQPVLGDSKLTAIVSASNNVNVAQVASTVTVGFATLAGTLYTTVGAPTVVSGAGAFTVGATTSLVAGTNTLKAEATVSPAASTQYVAQALVSGAEKGNEDLKATSIASIASFQSVTSTDGNNVKVVNATSVSVRPGTFVVPVSALAYKTGTTAAAAGIPVTVTIAETNATSNTDAATFSAGGKVLTDSTSAIDSVSFTVNTNADGKVLFDLSVVGTKEVDAIAITVASQNATPATTTFSFDAATVGTLVNASVLGTSAVLKKAPGSTFALKFAAKDSYGQALGAGYRVFLTETTGAVFVATADLVGGAASFNVTDSTTVNEVYNAELQSYSATTGVWSAENNINVTPLIGILNVPATVTLTPAAATAVLNNNALTAADTRKGEVAPTVAGGTTLSGTVVDASAIAAYSDVTLSAANVLFAANGVYSVGSITVQTDAAGNFAGVSIYSNISGATVITATAGAASKTATVTFDAPVVGKATTWSVDGPATSLPGRTISFVAVAADKYGNKVSDNAAWTYTGPGILVAAKPTTANGTLSVLLGADEVGTGTVTYKFDADNDGDTTDANESITKTVAIGFPEPSAIVNVIGHRVYVKFNDSKGEEVSAVIGGVRITKMATYNGYVVSRWIKTPGKYAVKAYVAGDLVKASTVTVK